MDKLKLQDLEKLDFKRVVGVCSGSCKKSDEELISELLKDSIKCIDSTKDSIKLFCEYKYGSGSIELDDSNGTNKYMRAIYNILWGRHTEDEDGYGNFMSLFIVPKDDNGKVLLYGGDVVNTVQTVLGWETNKSIEDMKTIFCKNSDKLFDILKDTTCKEIFEYSSYIGNFVLVPAYFNPFKGGVGSNLHDFMDEGLSWLKKNEWDVAKELKNHVQIKRYRNLEKLRKFLISINIEGTYPIPDVGKKIGKNMTEKKVEEIKNYILDMEQRRYRSFSISDFNKYINTMFLWDYTLSDSPDSNNMYIVKSLCKGNWSDKKNQEEYNGENECRSSEMSLNEIKNFISNAKYAIERRSCFMVAMLRIALDVNLEGEKYKYAYNDTVYDEWQEWKVSPIYKKIMHDVFLKDNPYSDYEEVITKMSDVVEKVDIDDLAKDNVCNILKGVREKLVSSKKNISRSAISD